MAFCPNCDVELSEDAAECANCGATFGVGSAWLPSVQRGVVRYRDKRLATRVPVAPVVHKVLEACFLGAFSVIALAIPFLNIPFLVVAGPLLFLPWAHDDNGAGLGAVVVESWRARAALFVYFSGFWGWVAWYRERRRVARLAKRLASGHQSGPGDRDLLPLLIVAVLPFLLLAALLVPGGWVVIAIAVGFAGTASYRGMRASGLPWGGVFFLLCVLYAVVVVAVIAV